MSSYFRAIALDYDGTLVEGERAPDPDVLAALREAGGDGRRLVLVTGRVLGDLERVFPAARASFDAIVAENGAVLALPGAPPRLLAPPVPAALADALARRGAPVRRGLALLDTLAI